MSKLRVDAPTPPANSAPFPSDALLGAALRGRAPPRGGSHHWGRCRPVSTGTPTHQFFIHFCFDVSGESVKCLWNRYMVSTLGVGGRWGLAGSWPLPCNGCVSTARQGGNSVRTETQAWGSPAHPHLSPATAGTPPLTQTTTSPEPMIQGGGITLDWSERKLRLGGGPVTCPKAARGSLTPRALSPRSLCCLLCPVSNSQGQGRKTSGSLAKQASFWVAALKGLGGRVKGLPSQDG